MLNDLLSIQKTFNPEPLFRPKLEGLPLPMAHLGPLREVAQAIADLTQSPIEIGFQSLLAVSSLAVQAHVNAETLSGTTPTSLFLLTVAPSGERKSACDKLALEPVHRWEEDQYSAYLRRRKAYEFELDVYENMQRKAVKTLSGGDADEVIESDVIEEPVAPVIPRKILSDVTSEGILHHHEEGDPSIGVISDEGGQFFGGHAMSKENQLKSSAAFSRMWDGSPLNRTRGGQSLITFRHRRGCLHLMLQPGVAEDVFGNEIMRDQGFLSRCLIAQPKSKIGTRLIVETETEASKRLIAEEKLAEFHAKIYALLSLPPSTTKNPRELAPRTLTLSSGARSILVAFANEVERQQAQGGDLAHITGFASKAAEQAARIAGVFALLTDPDACALEPAVMLDAVELMAWYLSEAQRALDAGHIDPSLQKAELLRVWLLDKMPNAAFTKRVIVRGGPSAVRDTKTVEHLLGILERHHWIMRCPAANVNGRQSAQTWRVVSSV